MKKIYRISVSHPSLGYSIVVRLISNKTESEIMSYCENTLVRIWLSQRTFRKVYNYALDAKVFTSGLNYHLIVK